MIQNQSACADKDSSWRSLRRRLGIAGIYLTILLALGGCASMPSPSISSESRSSAATVENVNDTTNTARLVIFPVYNSVDTRAYFDAGAHNASREARQRPTYDLSVDGHHVATFSDNQFVEIDVRPGRHTLDVTEHGWLGTTLRSATLPANVNMRQAIFIAIPSSTTDIALQTVDAHYGTEKISGREKVAIDQN